MSQSQVIHIPNARCANDDSAAARRRRELRDALLKEQTVSVNQQGELNKGADSNSIQPPPGKLASSFYWYERDPELFQGEISAMKKFFPQFRLEKLPDNRLSWVGVISVNNLRPGGGWILQAIYDNNHPSNSSYGGSVKVYPVEPDLNDLARKLGRIPHVLSDAIGNFYLCTSRKEDFRASIQHSTTAASALAWSARWIAVFELWLAGDVTTDQFSSHIF